MTRIRLYTWMAAFTLVGLIACETNQSLAPVARGPSAPAQTGSAVQLASQAAPTVAAPGKVVAPLVPPPPFYTCKGGNSSPVTGSMVIGSAGGTLTFGPHSLIVPAGALSAPTTITAATLHGDTLAVTFGPTGLQFKTPATLVLSYKHCTIQPADTLSVMLVNNQMTEMIQMVPSHDKKLKQAVEGLIQHFSVYAASESRIATRAH